MAGGTPRSPWFRQSLTVSLNWSFLQRLILLQSDSGHPVDQGYSITADLIQAAKQPKDVIIVAVRQYLKLLEGLGVVDSGTMISVNWPDWALKSGGSAVNKTASLMKTAMASSWPQPPVPRITGLQPPMNYMNDLGEIPLPAPPPLESLEVNLVECLVGWKVLDFNSRLGKLFSPTYPALWNPLEPLEAKCTTGHAGPCVGEANSQFSPCGIYAAEKKSGAYKYVRYNSFNPNYGIFYGIFVEIYGWGRYVRGEAGWRSQFAYPKAIHLNADQVDLIEPLKCYGVPIYVEQPGMRMFDPEEEGYGYRGTEEEGNRGAVEGSGSEEDRGPAGDTGTAES